MRRYYPVRKRRIRLSEEKVVVCPDCGTYNTVGLKYCKTCKYPFALHHKHTFKDVDDPNAYPTLDHIYCNLSYKKGKLYLNHLGFENDTFINNKAVSDKKEIELRNRDTITLKDNHGNTLYELTVKVD